MLDDERLVVGKVTMDLVKNEVSKEYVIGLKVMSLEIRMK